MADKMVRVKQETYERMQEHAKASGMKIKSIAENAISNYLEGDL